MQCIIPAIQVHDTGRTIRCVCSSVQPSFSHDVTSTREHLPWHRERRRHEVPQCQAQGLYLSMATGIGVHFGKTGKCVSISFYFSGFCTPMTEPNGERPMAQDEHHATRAMTGTAANFQTLSAWPGCRLRQPWVLCSRWCTAMELHKFPHDFQAYLRSLGQAYTSMETQNSLVSHWRHKPFSAP